MQCLQRFSCYNYDAERGLAIMLSRKNTRAYLLKAALVVLILLVSMLTLVMRPIGAAETTVDTFLTDYANVLDQDSIDVININTRQLLNKYHIKTTILVVKDSKDIDMSDFFKMQGYYDADAAVVVIVCQTESKQLNICLSPYLENRVDLPKVKAISQRYTDMLETQELSSNLICNLSTELCTYLTSISFSRHMCAFLIQLLTVILLIFLYIQARAQNR